MGTHPQESHLTWVRGQFYIIKIISTKRSDIISTTQIRMCE